MDYTIIILFIIALLLGICWITREQRKIRAQRIELAKYGNICAELEKAQTAYDETQANLSQAREDYATISAEVASAKEEVNRYNCESQHVQKLIAIQRDRIDNDIVPAKQLGMKTIWVKQGFGSLWNIMDESEKADIEVNNLSDILNFLQETSYEICKEIKKR